MNVWWKMAKVIKEADMGSVKVEESIKQWTLNYTDIILNSNKFYSLEVVKTNKGYFLYTQYGRVGGTKVKEYRQCSDQADAESEATKIVKAKTKKGYVEVSLVKSDVGSDAAQAKIEKVSATTEQLKKAGITVKEEPAAVSKLHPEVQDLVRTWFGVTQEFVDLNLDTSKCSLGQLSILQITKGKDLLDEARKIVHMTKPDEQELNKLTNYYYSNIPHNFGYTRIDANALRLDSDVKIDKAFDMLECSIKPKMLRQLSPRRAPLIRSMPLSMLISNSSSRAPLLSNGLKEWFWTLVPVIMVVWVN